MKPKILRLAAFALLPWLGSVASSIEKMDLCPAGSFPVGVTTTVFMDTSRTDAFTMEPRTLVTEIWYPATDDARHLPKNKYSDFLPGGVTPELDELVRKTYKHSAAEIDKVFWNESVRDCRVRDGKFP